MSFYKPSFSIGKLTVVNNIFCSPLAGCSDLPFRKMVQKYRPGLIFCEMVKMDAMIRNDPGTFRLLDFSSSMHPIGAQLCGSNPKHAAPCARIVEELGFDCVDLNCGCPVDKITKDNSGSGLLRHPEQIGEILSNIASAVSIPVTLKIRAGWDETCINGPQVTQIAERAGADGIFVHGRTRKQGYRGPANWEYIRQCKRAAHQIPVFGNGDVFDPQSAERMLIETGCDGVLLSRGLFGKPYLIEDITRHLTAQPPIERRGEEIRDLFLEHLDIICAYRPVRKALLDLRRIGLWYLKRGGGGSKQLKELVNSARDLSQVRREIERFNWGDDDRAPGAL